MNYIAKKHRLIACFLFASVLSIILIPIVLADAPRIGCPSIICIGGNDNTGNIGDEPLSPILERAIGFLLIIGGAGGVLMAVAAGVLMVLSGGNEERRTRAVKMFIYAGAGILLAMFAYIIVYMVGAFDYSNGG
jgi:hypothetical protein